jgi:glycerol-3-phosphate acyltransferase PlsY
VAKAHTVRGVEFKSYLLTALGAYLIGSVPTGYLWGKARGIDIRTAGSGNIGATNVFRTLGKKAGIAVLVIDGLKGYLACRWFAGADDAQALEYHKMLAGLFVILGHNYTCWLKFKGGKGIATSAGVMAALVPAAFGIALGTWVIVFLLSKYVSVASITAAGVLPFAVYFTTSSRPMLVLGTVFGLLAIYRHKTNIQRLMNGTESRFGKKKAL